MSVIANLEVSAEAFELGRILDVDAGGTLELENLVPLGAKAVPFFSVHDDQLTSFERRVNDHPSVQQIQEVNRTEDERLYALDWSVSEDRFFQGIIETDAQLLSARGGPSTWEFELRLSTHEALSAFQTYCSDAEIDLTVSRIYNPTRPDVGLWYGLSPAQRDTLIRAVEAGYYDIPRRISTKDLAEEFDISDQAVTERLRRAIVTLVENSLVAAREDEAKTEFAPTQ